MSLVGALTPLGKVARKWTQWLAAVTVYTVVGLVTSLTLGASLGALGRWAGTPSWHGEVLALTAGLSLVLMAREWGWIRFRLPERRQQTEKAWMHELGPLGAAALWGLHLSLAFLTRVNFGGFWLVTILAFGLGDPAFGALIFGAHWLGRALPIWVAPLFFEDPNRPEELVHLWAVQRSLYGRIQGFGLLSAAVALGVWLGAGGSFV
jgi:hypothetical protein